MVKLVGVIGGGEDKDKGSEGGEGMGRVACLARRQFPLVREREDRIMDTGRRKLLISDICR